MTTFYGVWVGRVPGLYDSWDGCKKQTEGFSGALFCKLNATEFPQALSEYQDRFNEDVAKGKSTLPEVKNDSKKEDKSIPKAVTKSKVTVDKPILDTLTVDGASNGSNCEFQVVWYPQKELVYKSPVYQGGTNNIGEFLGLVYTIKFIIEKGLTFRVYTDSVTAMAWVRDKKANTTAHTTGKATKQLITLIKDAEDYLKNNADAVKKVKVLKWNTKEWGEIPADYGRK